MLGTDQRYYAGKIEVASSGDNGFYQYTKDGHWMQDAVGEQNSWIKIDGMARWHIRRDLDSLQTGIVNSVTLSYSSSYISPESDSST